MSPFEKERKSYIDKIIEVIRHRNNIQKNVDVELFDSKQVNNLLIRTFVIKDNAFIYINVSSNEKNYILKEYDSINLMKELEQELVINNNNNKKRVKI